MAVLVFTLAAVAVAAPVARAGGYGSAPYIGTQGTEPKTAPAPAGGAPTQGTDPFAAVQKVKLTSKNIIITFRAPEYKNHKRNLVIDYGELAPGLTSSKGGMNVGGRSPLFYGITALIGWSVLGRVRRAFRRIRR